MARKLIAIWDEAISQITLGKGLIFLEEVNHLVSSQAIDQVSLIYCSDRPMPKFFDLPAWCSELCHVSSPAKIKPEIMLGDVVFWGMNKADSLHSYDDSYIYLQKMCGDRLPVLTPKKVWRDRANEYLAPYREDNLIVILHLKQNPTNVLSNAQFDQWAQFIESAQFHGKKPMFVIVGNETPTPLLTLPNVVWTGGVDLCLDLAIIAAGDAFMGMSSGLCQMAMFSEKPYVIFKHPGHHVEEMKRDFGGRKSFSFSNEQQNFLIAADQHQTLMTSFQTILEGKAEKNGRV